MGQRHHLDLPGGAARPQEVASWAGPGARALARPATCAERGVTACFTTPQLHGSRLRAAPQTGLEVIVPNPSGRDGWFVVPWSAVLEQFKPSLADRALVLNLQDEKLTPSSLRAQAVRVAAKGLAGRAARRAAHDIALRGGLVGANRITRIQTFMEEMAQIIRETAGDADLRRAEGLYAQGSAALTAAASQPTADPQGGERREWLLDGWDLLAAGWSVAKPEDRPSLLRRLAALAPPVPLEVEGWVGGEYLAAAGSPRGGSNGGAVTQSLAEAAFARWLGG